MSNTRRCKIISPARPDPLPPGTTMRLRNRYHAGREVEWTPGQAGAALASVPEEAWSGDYADVSAALCREFDIDAETLATIAGPDLLAAAAVSAWLGDARILSRQAGRVRRALYDADLRELLGVAS